MTVSADPWTDEQMTLVRQTLVALTDGQQAMKVRVGSVEDRLTDIEQGLNKAAGLLREAASILESLLDSGDSQEAEENARKSE